MRADRHRADEWQLAFGALKVLAALGVPLVAGAALVAGWPGAAGALAGIGLVALLFGGSAVLLSVMVTRRPTAAVAALVVGLVVRLIAYAAVLAWLDGLGWVHRPSLAAAAGLGVAVALAYELRLLARMPQLFWIDTETDRPHQAASTAATRSQSL